LYSPVIGITAAYAFIGLKMIRRRDHKYPNIPVRPHIEGVPEQELWASDFELCTPTSEDASLTSLWFGRCFKIVVELVNLWM
jgi:hypothetical protein